MQIGVGVDGGAGQQVGVGAAAESLGGLLVAEHVQRGQSRLSGVGETLADHQYALRVARQGAHRQLGVELEIFARLAMDAGIWSKLMLGLAIKYGLLIDAVGEKSPRRTARRDAAKNQLTGGLGCNTTSWALAPGLPSKR
ncbi:hypothetical protein JOS77_11305 [Chromobacterium haemolyticum]|nr:hypothetical protein JOS77_11305 [Chromobacterium haemolyticum]